MKILRRIILLSLLVMTILIIYGTYMERNLLTVKNHNININEDGDDTLKIVQFTDTQLGEYYSLDQLSKAVDKINSLNPDIVVFTGDLIDNVSIYEDTFNVSKVLEKIKANLGKYAVYGNHDYGGGAVRYYEDIMNEAGFTVLKNEGEVINFKGKVINILGGDDGLLGNHDANKTAKGINKDYINILLLHEPDLIEEYINYDIDLVLAGHSHGGQVYIPFYGPIKKNVLAEKYTKGFYQLDNKNDTMLYVNSGLGNTKLPFRLFNIPQVSLFNIKI